MFQLMPSNPSLHKVQAVVDLLRPTTSQALRQFFGLVSYYHHFIPHASSIHAPLHQLVDHKHPSFVIPWTDDFVSSFQKAKDTLSHACLLSHPIHGAPLALHLDVSDTGVVAVQEQLSEGKWHPLGFFSQTLTTAEHQ